MNPQRLSSAFSNRDQSLVAALTHARDARRSPEVPSDSPHCALRTPRSPNQDRSRRSVCIVTAEPARSTVAAADGVFLLLQVGLQLLPLIGELLFQFGQLFSVARLRGS